MAGRRMKLFPTDPAFVRAPLQQRTVENWSRALLNPDELQERARVMMGNWLDHKSALNEPHFTLEGPNPDLMANLMQGVNDLYGIVRVTFEFIHRPIVRINHTTEDEFMVLPCQNDNVGIMPLMLIGMHRSLLRRQYGFFPGLQWNISIAGAVATAMGLGGMIEDG